MSGETRSIYISGYITLGMIQFDRFYLISGSDGTLAPVYGSDVWISAS